MEGRDEPCPRFYGHSLPLLARSFVTLAFVSCIRRDAGGSKLQEYLMTRVSIIVREEKRSGEVIAKVQKTA
jgi:hypothetical protein